MIGAISLEGEGKRNKLAVSKLPMWGRLPYAEGGREKYSTSTGVPKKIFSKLESVVRRASVTMQYGVPGKMARTIAGSSINVAVALCPDL
jgi:hypothetical protein